MIIIYGSSGQDGRLLTDFYLGRRLELGTQELVGITRDTVVDLRREKLIAEYSATDGVVSFIRNLEKGKIKKIFYFAAHHSSAEITNEDKCSETYGTAAINKDLPLIIAEEASKCAKVRFIYASSARIYEGYESPIIVTEETEPIPLSPYSRAKHIADVELRRLHELGKIELTTMVFFGHESRYRNTTFLSAKIASGLATIVKQGRGHIRVGEPNTILNWGHAEEYVRAAFEVSCRACVPKLVVGAENTITLEDYIEACCRAVNISSRNLIERDHSIRLRPGMAHTASLKLMSETLGWKPRLDLDRLAGSMMAHHMSAGTSQ